MMKRVLIFTLLITLLLLVLGCDNGSVADPAAEKSSSLVKVCLTVGDSSGAQKSAAIDGSYWTSLTYQYNAVPQWADPQGTPIHGAAGWTPINYSAGMSLGYFTPGQWVFGIRIKNGSTVVYEGFSDVINVKNTSVAVDVLVNKLVTNAVAGSVRISVTAPSALNDTLTISYTGTSSGGPFTVTAESASDRYPFEYTVSGLTQGTYNFTLTHSDDNIEDSIEVVMPSNSIAVISGHMDNRIWQLDYSTARVHSIGATWTGAGSVQTNAVSAAVGDPVSFYVKPASGAELNNVTVSWSGGSITPSVNMNLYSFIMPDGDVSINATFDNVDTDINMEHFKIIFMALYDDNLGVKAFGRSSTAPRGVEYLGLNDVKIWYDEDDQQIYWFADNVENKVKFSTTSMAEFFKDLDKFESISLQGFDTSNITDMHGMFENCVNLRAVDLDGVDTSSVTNMANMFYKAGYNNFPSYETGVNAKDKTDNTFDLTISNMEFDTASVNNMSQMFSLCTVTDLSGTNINDWDTGSVTTFYRMFAGYGTLKSPYKYWYTKIDSSTFNISGWDTSSCTNFASMFDYCNRLTSMNISGWDFAAATDMNRMFDRCESITSFTFPTPTVLDNVTDMCFIFADCLELPENGFESILSKWDIDNCPIDFVDYLGTTQAKADTPNRITKGTKVLKNSPKTFRTYGHENDVNPNIQLGGNRAGDEAYAAQRMVLINQ